MKKVACILIFLGGWVFSYSQTNAHDYQYALIEAVKQKNLGNIAGAIELYKMVVNANDSVAVAYYELGSLFAATGRLEDAVKNLKKANQLDPENSWYRERYIDILVLNKQYDEAINILEDYLKDVEDEVTLEYNLANIYFISGKSKKALKILGKIEKEKGISSEVSLLKANIFEKEKKYDKALGEVLKIMNFWPESIDFRVAAAELATKMKDEDLAAEYYLQVYELDSTNIYAITNLTDHFRNRKDYISSFFYLNKSFESNEIEYDRKIAILGYYLSDQFFFQNYNNKLQILVETLLSKYDEKRDIHLFATDFYIQNRKYELALDALSPVLVEGESTYELWRQGILLANAIGKKEKSYDLASSAFDIFPDSVEIVFYKGLAEFENEEYNEVIKTFSDINLMRSARQDIFSQSRAILAESYYHLEDYSLSDSIFRNIVQEEPDNYLVMNNFSYYLALRDVSLQEAKRISYKVVKNNPENGTYLDTYAWILFKLGEFKDAELYINKALNFGGSNDPDVNEHAGEIHISLESYHIARSFFQKAIILGGEKERLIKRLEEIEELDE